MMAYPGFAPYPGRTRSAAGETAETLVLIALIFQALGSAVVLFVAFLVLPGFFFLSGLIGAVLLAIFGPIIVATIVLLYVGYAYSYRRIRDGNYDGARTATLVLGILMLIFAVVPGVLYIVAYTKLDDAARERAWFGSYPGMAAYAPAVPFGAPTPLGPMCPRCGRPPTFIAQYARHYCYHCGAYL